MWGLRNRKLLQERGESFVRDRRRDNGRRRVYGEADFAPALALRAERPHDGERMLAWRARRTGHAVPSPATIGRKLNALGLANKPSGPGDQRLYPRPEQRAHGDRRIMDLWSSWWVGDARVDLATIGDPVSRLCLAELGWAVSSELYTRALALSVRHLGPMKMLTLDNGVGLAVDTRAGTLPQSVRWALHHGAAVTYIPPAQPWRNGRLERFHWTMEREFWVPAQPKTKDEAARKLQDWLNEYNMGRPHSALGFDPPAAHGPYAPLSGEVLRTPARLGPQAGTVRFIRLVETRGLIDCQGAVLRVHPMLAGQSVTVDCAVTPGEDGMGRVPWQPKKDLPSEVVATFRHRIERGGANVTEQAPLFDDVHLLMVEHEVAPNTGLLQAQYDKRIARPRKRGFVQRGKAVAQARQELAADEAEGRAAAAMEV